MFKTAVFAGGCFWCTEAVFQKLRGVKSVMPGYAGGSSETATYEKVSMGTTAHAEAIKFEYDPIKISYNDLLSVFFATHDPTTLNKQGNDVGTQYRSAIFYGDDSEKQEAQEFINQLTQDKVFSEPIVTTLEPLATFYEAEDYHKNYYERNAGQPYCQIVISPKLKKLKEKFAALLDSNDSEVKLSI